MICVLRYGADAEARFELDPDTLVADCQAPRGEPVNDVADALAAALASPVCFPALSKSVVPGDHVAIALEPGVPQADSIVSIVVRTLIDAGIEPQDITVVTAEDVPTLDRAAALAATPVASGRGAGIKRINHAPQDRGSLSYLANIGEGKPVYLNRAICEADFVLPIGCQRLESSLGYRGVCDGIFPTFADAATQQRYRSPVAADSHVQRKRLRKQSDEVGWLLGALFTVRVLPGPGDSILGALAGEMHAVSKYGVERCRSAWKFQVPRRASLVVAALSGGPSQQTWHHLGRAVAAARQAVDAGGTIAICSELTAPPGPALQQMAAADSPEEARRAIAHERSSDALVAGELLHALENGRVYLLSHLSQDVVEQLGIAPVDSPAALARLATRHDSCILLANAQHAELTTAEEAAPQDASLRHRH